MKIKVLYLFLTIFLIVMIALTSCETIKVAEGDFYIEYPGNAAKNVPLQITVKIKDPYFSKAVTYDVYLNGELVKAGANSTEVVLDKKLNSDTEYVMVVKKKALGKEVIEEEMVRFETTRKPVFIYTKPLKGMKYYEGMELEWQAVDPDGDELRYDVYIGEKGGEFTLVASDIREGRYKLKGLVVGKEYEWKVVAKDDKGAESESRVGTVRPFLIINKIYGIGLDGLWEFEITDVNNIKVKKIGLLDGMRDAIRDNAILYHDKYLYVLRDKLLIYERDSSGNFVKIEEQSPPAVAIRIRYENGYIIGDNSYLHGYFIYDASAHDIVHQDYNGSAVSIYGDRFVVFGGEHEDWVGGGGDGYYSLYVYDRDFNVIANKEGNLKIHPKSGIAYKKKFYMSIVKDDGTYLYRYDFSDPKEFDINTYEKYVKLDESGDTWVEVFEYDGKIFVKLMSLGKLYIIDSDSMEILKTIDGVWMVKKLFPLNIYAFTMGDGGCFGFKLYDENFNEVASYDDGKGKPDSVMVVGNYVYARDMKVRDNSKAILIYDKNLNFIDYFLDDLVDENYVGIYGNYMISISGGWIKVYDVSNPARPRLVSNNGSATKRLSSISINKNYMFVAGSSSLYIFNASKLPSLNLIKNFPIDIEPYYLSAGNNIIIIGERDGGYEFVDVSDPYNPKVTLKRDYETYKEKIRGKPIIVDDYAYAFVKDESTTTAINFIEVYNVSNPSIPRLINRISFDKCVAYRDIYYYNNYLILGEWTSSIIDISDRENPRPVQNIPPYSRIAINYDDSVVYLSKEQKGIYAYNFDDLVNDGERASEIYKDEWFAIYDVAVGE